MSAARIFGGTMLIVQPGCSTLNVFTGASESDVAAALNFAAPARNLRILLSSPGSLAALRAGFALSPTSKGAVAELTIHFMISFAPLARVAALAAELPALRALRVEAGLGGGGALKTEELAALLARVCVVERATQLETALVSCLHFAGQPLPAGLSVSRLSGLTDAAGASLVVSTGPQRLAVQLLRPPSMLIGTTKGTGGDVLILEEAAYCDPNFFYETLAPILLIDRTSLLAISTLTSEINFYSRLMKLRDAATGRAIFTILQIQLACAKCIEDGKSHECVHMLHLAPRWQVCPPRATR